MIRTLQSLRLIFILLVLFSHLSWGDVPPLRFGGECGVSFFFMLSGFVLSIGYGAKIEEGAAFCVQCGTPVQNPAR